MCSILSARMCAGGVGRAIGGRTLSGFQRVACRDGSYGWPRALLFVIYLKANQVLDNQIFVPCRPTPLHHRLHIQRTCRQEAAGKDQTCSATDARWLERLSTTRFFSFSGIIIHFSSSLFFELCVHSFLEWSEANELPLDGMVGKSA